MHNPPFKADCAKCSGLTQRRTQANNFMNQRTAFFVSDRTGLTAEMLGRSLLSQFDGIEFQRVTLPYLDTAEQARGAGSCLLQGME
jgi:hypothetical protein